MRPEDRELIAQLCAARSGQRVDPAKDYVLETRLSPVARREGFEAVGDLVNALRTRRDERLIWAVVEAMTPNETAFFRDRDLFDRFENEILPEIARNSAGQPIRIWSAACGAGQEVYSLAMLIDEIADRYPDTRFELFASDLSERALEKAQSGLYTQFEVQRGLPIRRLVRHFEKTGETWELSPRLRQAIRWRRLNLVGDLSRVRGFDVIFCPHVIESMIEPARARVAENVAAALNPGGAALFAAGEDPTLLSEALHPAAGGGGVYLTDHRAAA